MLRDGQAVGAERVDELGGRATAVLGQGDDPLGAGLAQDVADLRVTGAMAETHDRETGALGGDEDDVHRDAVGKQHREPRAAATDRCRRARFASRSARASYSAHVARTSSATYATASGRSTAHCATDLAHGGLAPPPGPLVGRDVGGVLMSKSGGHSGSAGRGS